MKPESITFTGVDEYTSGGAMAALSARYPIEWGVLFSPTRQGSEIRYPALRHIERLLRDQPHLNYAAHLCGQDSRDVRSRGASRHDSLLKQHFTRVQINTTEPVDTKRLREWGSALSVSVIVQCRGAFPIDDRVEWLFDPSGGRGIEQTAWPQPSARRCGYAGGLRPDNVARAVRAMTLGAAAGTRIWIDMEGVRDNEDRFSLAKCREVCEAVYSRALAPAEA